MANWYASPYPVLSNSAHRHLQVGYDLPARGKLEVYSSLLCAEFRIADGLDIRGHHLRNTPRRALRLGRRRIRQRRVRVPYTRDSYSYHQPNLTSLPGPQSENQGRTHHGQGCSRQNLAPLRSRGLRRRYAEVRRLAIIIRRVCAC